MDIRNKVVRIESSDYWFKRVEFLQQNWALVDQVNDGGQCIVFFFGDTAGVFDRISFNSKAAAREALQRNGFRLFDKDPEAHEFITKPQPPFYESQHPNGPIYSSGRYWKS